MKMGRNFLNICETILTRVERGGFLVGDVVTVKNINKVPENIRADLKGFIDQGLNLKVVDIINEYPSDKPGSSMNSTGNVTIVVAADYGGGRHVGKFPVGMDSLEVVDRGINLDPIPDALRRDNQITLKPELVNMSTDDFADQTNKSDVGNGKLSTGDRNLAQSNTNINKVPAAVSPKPTSLGEAYNAVLRESVGRFNIIKKKIDPAPGEFDSNAKEITYDIVEDGNVVGTLTYGTYFGNINGQLYGRHLPDISRYGSAGSSGPLGNLHAFLKSKTGQVWMSRIKSS